MTKTVKKTEKRKKGDLGEEITCKYLEKRGYKVLERNYLKPWGEIDIIAENTANCLVFVEVKTVSHESGLRAEENMHPSKLKKLHRVVQSYLLDHKVPDDKEWQIDLACVYLDFTSRKAKVELFNNIIL
jgi:putative endonuclease